MKRLFFMMIFLLAAASLWAQTTFRPEVYSYEASPVIIGVNDEIVLQMNCRIKDTKTAIEDASACAVHALIFSGYPSSGNVPAAQAMFRGEMTPDRLAFFEKFFNQRRYRKYIVSTAKSSMRISKMKRDYYVNIAVSVNKSALRHCLEDEGIIDRLDKIFR